jgi:hypothetical protein
VQPVGNVKRVSSPREGEAEPPEGTPWGPGFRPRKRSEEEGREGQEEGRLFFQGPAEGSPGDAQAQESRGSAPVITVAGGRDAQLISRAQAAEASMSGLRVWQENVRADRPRETANGP